MPIIKSAIKKMRKDRKRTLKNKKNKENLKNLVKKMRKSPSLETMQLVSSAYDKASKTHLIHPNKASRLKSRLSKILKSSSLPKATKK